MWLMIPFFASLAWLDSQDLVPKREYPLPEGTYLSDPHFMDYSPQGTLYLLERNAAKIHRWSADGAYLGSFGKKGQGPGELDSPRLIHVTKDRVWVWDPRFRFHLFDHEGRFIRDMPSPTQPIRRFAVLDPNRLLIAYQERHGRGADMYFALANDKGKLAKTLKKFKNEMFLSSVKGDDHGRIKAYGPDIDIHADKVGTWWFGFSQENTLYRMGPDGRIHSRKQFDFPRAKPTDAEREAFQNIEVPGPNGEPITLKNLPNLSVSYEHDKAFYTHLLIGDRRMAALLTPVSGNDQHKGYFQGSYYLMDMRSGEAVGRGSFSFPEGSLLLINNGRAVACVVDENDDFTVTEITIDGLYPN